MDKVLEEHATPEAEDRRAWGDSHGHQQPLGTRQLPGFAQSHPSVSLKPITLICVSASIVHVQER